jgi:ParB-like chromosome segregation protein Spo0J
MHYDPRNVRVVERAGSVPDEKWNELPIENLPIGTLLEANEETLNKKSIDKVVSGAEPFREGYVTKLWRDKHGKLHVVDGHHRVAMYNALGKAMPVRIMDKAAFIRLMAQDN